MPASDFQSRQSQRDGVVDGCCRTSICLIECWDHLPDLVFLNRFSPFLTPSVFLMPYLLEFLCVEKCLFLLMEMSCGKVMTDSRKPAPAEARRAQLPGMS